MYQCFYIFATMSVIHNDRNSSVSVFGNILKAVQYHLLTKPMEWLNKGLMDTTRGIYKKNSTKINSFHNTGENRPISPLNWTVWVIPATDKQAF